MKNNIKKYFYAGAGMALLAQNTLAQAAISFGGSSTVNSGLKGSDQSADQSVQTLIGNGLKFLYILAVVYGIWGGFQILTAAGADDKVKKGKTILIQALTGLVVIWLAGSIVQWLVTGILGGTN
ncbi:MAG: hypothetical protein PHR68_01020 [Candidatus Gracilibacteria bacterium]|nr:hypothetical protein [Candidatus Gracilibacteria bacterium]